MINENVTWTVYDIESLGGSDYMVDKIADMIRSTKDISKSNIKIVTIDYYRGTTMEEKTETIRSVLEQYKDKRNYDIFTTTWLSPREFGDEKGLKRESKMLEALGFVDISELVQCQTNITRAYIYPNALGREIVMYLKGKEQYKVHMIKQKEKDRYGKFYAHYGKHCAPVTDIPEKDFCKTQVQG